MERSAASDRIFYIDSLFRRFLYHFLEAVVRALEGGNCGGKLLFARRRNAVQCGAARWRRWRTVIIAGVLLRGRMSERASERTGVRTRVENRSRARPPGRKNDVCTDTRITSDFPKRVTASLLGTSTRPSDRPARVCFIFAIFRFNFPRPV